MIHIIGSIPRAWYYLLVWSTSRILSLPAVKLLWKLLIQKGGGSFNLVILTNRSHHIISRSLPVPCLGVVMYNETRWPMFSVYLSYKPPSSWKILFRFGGRPRQFSPLKKFRDLVVPGGGFLKEIIIQWRQLKRGFSCGWSSHAREKMVCKRIVCTWTHTEE